MNKRYKEILDVVKADMERVNTNIIPQMDLKAPVKKEIEKFLQAPSKRIRSLVTILYMRVAKMYLLPEHYELLAAVELIHNASLAHDDVIDEAKIRRKRKTLNEKFDNQLAVISGDYILGLALEKLIKIGSLEVLDIFAQTVKNMCQGEIIQYTNRFKKTKLDSYIQKSERKTAALFVSALKSAVILADERLKLEKAEIFAKNFGTAFQIRDDLLNVMQKESSDIMEGIYNAPLIFSDDISIGIEKTRSLLNNYVEGAGKIIDNLEESVYKTALTELLELIENV